MGVGAQQRFLPLEDEGGIDVEGDRLTWAPLGGQTAQTPRCSAGIQKFAANIIKRFTWGGKHARRSMTNPRIELGTFRVLGECHNQLDQSVMGAAGFSRILIAETKSAPLAVAREGVWRGALEPGWSGLIP